MVLTGGFSSPIVTVRDPVRPLIAAVVLLAAAWGTAGAAFMPLVRGLAGSRERVCAGAAASASLCMLVFALAWSSRAAGGSDSSCYVLQAEAFARGHATLTSPIARDLPGMPNAVFAPTGFVPAREYGHAVPICAPGLSLAMAAAYLVHPAAVFVVVPVAAALLVWLTFVYGRRVDDAVTGACAAILVACSPIVLYQAVQPMSDVPAAAAWMAALVSASPIGAGLWAAAAILVRPNLALLVPLLLLRKRGQPGFPAHGNGDSRHFVAGLLPGIGILIVLNAVRYGGPLATGYGSTDALFSRAHLSANLLRYPRWVLETQTPFVLLALAAPWVLRRDGARTRLAWLSLGATALLVGTYLAYSVFDDWWYIRFLLPALPMLIGLSVTVLRAAVVRLPAAAGRLAVGTIVLALSVFGVQVALARHVTELQALESRFRLTGEYARDVLPHAATVIAVQQSGSVRFHGRHDTLVWDAIPPAALDATIASLQARGHQVFLALEDAEDAAFRLRFAGQRAVRALDRPPAASMHAPVRVRVYVMLP